MLDTVIRVFPQMSLSKPPPWFKSKFDLVKVCLESFIAAGESNRTFLLDDCPPEYATYLKKFGQVYEGKWGKKLSLYKAYEYAQKKLQGNILFLEDDYLWRPYTLPYLEQGLNRFRLVTPYDHPGHYADIALEAYVVGNTTWRKAWDNTHTFAVQSKTFQANLDDFYYGLHDWQMYHKLAEHGIKCYVPLNSFATHLVDGILAYNTDWHDIAAYYIKKLKL